MACSVAILEGGECISFSEVAVRSVTQSGQSGVGLLAAGNRLFELLIDLQSNGMSLQKRIKSCSTQRHQPCLGKTLLWWIAAAEALYSSLGDPGAVPLL